ncbi:MAG: hypothetical protein FWC68_00625 [Oscillospiraceae bacterium]|nr:hypothetical protein [Oscillospiraceae bacterium]
MKIAKKIYDEIIIKCLNMPIETGGILGGRNNIVSSFVFDIGLDNSSIQHYFPNIDKLNACLMYWQSNDIQFYGIVHSHLQKERKLSIGDLQYIRTIMLSMPKHITFLYFPIVLPRYKEIISYKAVRLKSEVSIINSNIKIINGRIESNEENQDE